MEITNHPTLGKQIDEEVTFTFEGMPLTVQKGKTVAAALMTHRVRKLGVSRKLIQPRGLFCANGRCCSCFMTIDGKEHVRSCMTLVQNGMNVLQNNSDPNVRK
ncbi:(2Fe-2S)-binding protein [Pseudalkalibacillus decolorationis]|uniref:(2Fe-2S)-binding protein n=1 Tax=Pseudalkalibacillus decolorationis TaxID=163879 RepID=UPI002147A292|nr:(2Fe-2S)-binding protein [Pseudalkalibacillus decolorationis]